MSIEIPSTTNRKLKFDHGEAIGMSQRWQKGQYCSILTQAGIVGPVGFKAVVLPSGSVIGLR